MLVENLMITENEIVDYLDEYLKLKGFTVEKCYTDQKGRDIDAKKDNINLLIEVKGATTSKNSARKGKTFSKNQITNHIARAIFKSMQDKEKEGVNTIVAIALPYTRKHYELIHTVEKTMKSIGIIIFFCDGQNIEIIGDNISGIL